MKHPLYVFTISYMSMKTDIINLLSTLLKYI
jgi:hypothetical protein